VPAYAAFNARDIEADSGHYTDAAGFTDHVFALYYLLRLPFYR
jgi:hypothetical protein